MTVAYLLAGGRRGIATVIQDAAGNITRREACESNVSNDARQCIDWDTGRSYHDMKNTCRSHCLAQSGKSTRSSAQPTHCCEIQD
jgi:hypothetical protein